MHGLHFLVKCTLPPSLDGHLTLLCTPFCIRTAFKSGFTDAATEPTCFFGMRNQADGEGPPIDGPILEGNSNDGALAPPVVIQPVINPSACEHNGIGYAVNSAYTNQCNSCQCVGIGLAACSLNACNEAEADCDYNGMKYWDGEQFMNDCNTCICNKFGANGPTVSCTVRACPDPIMPGK
jgi:hypothetical protein